MDAWRVEIAVREGLPDPTGEAARAALVDAKLPVRGPVRSRRGYLLEGALAHAEVETFAREVLADPVTDEFELCEPGAAFPPRPGRVTVLPLPGVTDPVAQSVHKALADCGLPAGSTGTY